MNGKRHAVTLIFAIMVGLIIGTAPIKLWPITSGQAQQASKEVTRSPRWEYCAITGMSFTIAGGKALATVWIRYLRNSGAEFVGISSTVSPTDQPKDEIYLRRWTASLVEQEGISLGGSATVDTSKEALYAQAKRDALARAIAQLGEEGWEMLGAEPRNFESLNVNITTNLNQTSGSVNSSFLLYFKRTKL